MPHTVTTVHVSISLDGFVAGPDQSLDNPLGVGGLALHEWHFDKPEGLNAVDQAWSDALSRPRGAYLMGRNMFGPVRGEWETWNADHDEQWRGWWGDEPPYHAPVVVLTHHEHEPIEMAGGTTFHFVTAGFEAGLAKARELGDGDVHVAGGASTVRQALAAGEVDSLTLDIAPILLGGGEPLFDEHSFDGTSTPRLSVADVGSSPYATHVRYDVIGPS